MHLPVGWLLPPFWKVGQLPKASAKAPRQRAEDATCFRCNVVSKVAELTQNRLQQLQLKSAKSQETVMWKAKGVFCRSLLPKLHLPSPTRPNTHSSFASPRRSNIDYSTGLYWACFTTGPCCCVPETSPLFSLFQHLANLRPSWCSSLLFPSSAWSWQAPGFLSLCVMDTSRIFLRKPPILSLYSVFLPRRW